mmetsp:Transcript_14306/g.34739  ORF Transcript_14306/g.34739 Transcript_14306/m.34739 type:complete len:320 (-) Transcript_14306:2223-3182(-)
MLFAGVGADARHLLDLRPEPVLQQPLEIDDVIRLVRAADQGKDVRPVAVLQSGVGQLLDDGHHLIKILHFVANPENNAILLVGLAHLVRVHGDAVDLGCDVLRIQVFHRARGPCGDRRLEVVQRAPHRGARAALLFCHGEVREVVHVHSERHLVTLELRRLLGDLRDGGLDVLQLSNHLARVVAGLHVHPAVQVSENREKLVVGGGDFVVQRGHHRLLALLHEGVRRLHVLGIHRDGVVQVIHHHRVLGGHLDVVRLEELVHLIHIRGGLDLRPVVCGGGGTCLVEVHKLVELLRASAELPVEVCVRCQHLGRLVMCAI